MEQNDLLLLQTVPAHHIQTIAKTRRAVQAYAGRESAEMPESQEPALEEIAEPLFEERACLAALRALSEAEMCVLRELVACGGRANSRDLALYLASPGSPLASMQTPENEQVAASAPVYFVPSSTLSAARYLGSMASFYPPPHPHGPFELALRRLLLLGLLFWGKQTNFAGGDYFSGVYDGVLIVPPTIARLVADQHVLEVKTGEERSQDERQIGEGARLLQRALYLYWSLVARARDGLPLVGSRLLSRTALRQVLERMAPLSRFWPIQDGNQIHSETDAPYLLFLRLLLLKLGLLVERQGTLRALPAREFFALPLAERAWRCFHLWLEDLFWNELAFVSNVVTQPGPAPLDPAHEEVARARQLVVQHILREAVDTWQPLPTFVARMKLHAPAILFPRRYGARAERYTLGNNPYGWNFRLKRGWLTHREGWYMVEGGFIRAVVEGALTWLGVVEMGDEEHSDMFRLVRGGALLAGPRVPTVLPENWGRLVVQPNFDLVVLAPVSESLLLTLDTFAECVRLEHIAQYHLSKASVTRAIQLGWTAEQVLQVLEERASGEAIPQNVRYSLQEWERQARRVELWPATTLLEVDDPALLDEFFADRDLRPWLRRRLAPTLAEVVSSRLSQLREVLWRRTYLAAQTRATDYQDVLTTSVLPEQAAQWELLPDGLLRPVYPLANLYLAAELARFTEEATVEARVWRRITPTSLRQALDAGLELARIISFLRKYCQNGIPGSLLVRLKLWGSDYHEAANVHLEETPLLSLSPQVLQDILADEEIGPLLGSPVPAEKRLVSIKTGQLERVLAFLRERGFEIS